MKIYDVGAVADAAGARRWIILVAENGAAFTPAPGNASYATREEAEAEATALAVEENRRDGP